MELLIVNETAEKRWMNYKKDFKLIAERCEEVLEITKAYHVSVIFIDAQGIHQINRDYRKIDRPTDVISFAL